LNGEKATALLFILKDISDNVSSMASRGLGRRANGTVENGIEKKLRKGVGAVSDLINRVIVEHLLPMEILNTITNN